MLWKQKDKSCLSAGDQRPADGHLRLSGKTPAPSDCMRLPLPVTLLPLNYARAPRDTTRLNGEMLVAGGSEKVVRISAFRWFCVSASNTVACWFMATV